MDRFIPQGCETDAKKRTVRKKREPRGSTWRVSAKRERPRKNVDRPRGSRSRILKDREEGEEAEQVGQEERAARRSRRGLLLA